MKAIGKITAKAIIGVKLAEIMGANVAAKAKNEAYTFERFEAMRIQGRVDKAVCKPSSLNPENIDVKLTGEFIATNCETGETYQSGTLYPIGAGLTELMAQAQPGSLFAVRVFVSPSAKTVQGYSFDFESALEIKASEAVSRLTEAFAALPAPGKTAAEKAAPAKSKGK